MTIPERTYRAFYSPYGFQENIEFDAHGNELYHGVSPNNITNAQSGWVIAKAVYTTIVVGGSNVDVMTHVSVLTGKIWDDRASITFP